jgi:hypothetical protein
MFFGGVHTAVVADGVLAGAGDPRRGGAVEVLFSDIPQALQ